MVAAQGRGESRVPSWGKSANVFAFKFTSILNFLGL